MALESAGRMTPRTKRVYKRPFAHGSRPDGFRPILASESSCITAFKGNRHVEGRRSAPAPPRSPSLACSFEQIVWRPLTVRLLQHPFEGDRSIDNEGQFSLPRPPPSASSSAFPAWRRGIVPEGHRPATTPGQRCGGGIRRDAPPP